MGLSLWIFFFNLLNYPTVIRTTPTQKTAFTPPAKFPYFEKTSRKINPPSPKQKKKTRSEGPHATRGIQHPAVAGFFHKRRAGSAFRGCRIFLPAVRTRKSKLYRLLVGVRAFSKNTPCFFLNSPDLPQVNEWCEFQRYVNHRKVIISISHADTESSVINNLRR